MHKGKLLKKLIIVTLVAVTGFSAAGVPIANRNHNETTVNAATTAQTKAFINKMGPIVQSVSRDKNLYSSVMLAQMILECSWGNSTLAVKANNYFGMKGSYGGQSYSVKSKEYDSKGHLYYAVSKFKKYPSAQASIMDYANHMRNGVSWDARYYSGTWRENASTYKKATAALSLRYSTSSAYDKTLNGIISMYGLHDLDSGEKVAYHAGQGSETVRAVSSSYRLYNHVKGTSGSVDKGTANKLKGKTLYADMRGEKSGGATWYRVRAKGTSTKYWVYSKTLKLRKTSYTDINTPGTFNGKAYALHNHVYGSNYLSKNSGKAATYKNKTYTINSSATTTDYNGKKSKMYRLKIGKTNHWVYSGAVNKKAHVKLENHRADGTESATVNAKSYALYNTVKYSTDNTVSYGSSTQLTNKKIKLLKRAENKTTKTTWYQIKSGTKKYWVYSKALNFAQSVSYKPVQKTAKVSTVSKYKLHNHVYNSLYLSLTTGQASDGGVKGQAVAVTQKATIKQRGKADSFMYRFTVKSTGKTFWAYSSALKGNIHA